MMAVNNKVAFRCSIFRRGFIKGMVWRLWGDTCPYTERAKREKKKKTFKILFYTKSYPWIEHDLEIFLRNTGRREKWTNEMWIWVCMVLSQAANLNAEVCQNSREKKSYHFITSTQNQKKRKLQRQKKSVQHWIKF